MYIGKRYRCLTYHNPIKSAMSNMLILKCRRIGVGVGGQN